MISPRTFTHQMYDLFFAQAPIVTLKLVHLLTLFKMENRQILKALKGSGIAVFLP